MVWYRILIFVMLFVPFLRPSVLFAQEVLTLKKAIDYALKQNKNLRSKELIREASSYLREASDRIYLPKLSAVEGYQRTNNPPMAFTHKLSQKNFEASDFQLDKLNHPDPISNWHTELRLEQPVFNQGREIVEKKRGKLYEEFSVLQERYSKELIAFEIVGCFFQIITTAREIEVLRQSLEEAKEAERLAQERYQKGVAIYSDLLNASTRRAGVETRLSNTVLRKRDLIRKLNHLMGESLEKEWLFEEDTCSQEQASISKEELEALVEHGKNSRADVLLKELDVRMEGLNRDLARFAFFPSLNLYGKYAWDSENLSSGSNSYELGFVLSFNLFNGLSDTLRLKAANRSLEAKELSLRELKELVAVELREAWHVLEASKREYQVSLEDVSRAEEALRILKARYREGLALFIEVLNGQVMLEESLLKKTRALYATKFNYVRVMFLAGKILEVYGGCEKE